MTTSEHDTGGAPQDATGVVEINAAMNHLSSARPKVSARGAAELDALLERVRAALWEMRAAASWLEELPGESDDARTGRRGQYEEAIRRAEKALR